MTVPHLSRTARLAAVAAVAGLALGGCSAFSPQTTQNITYAPSDGVQGEVGPVLVRNAIVLTAEEGAPGSLVTALFNTSDQPVQLIVDVQDGAGTQTLDLAAGENLSLGPQAEEQVFVEGLDVMPGLTTEVTFIGGDSSLNLRVPVLDGTLPPYDELVADIGDRG